MTVQLRFRQRSPASLSGGFLGISHTNIIAVIACIAVSCLAQEFFDLDEPPANPGSDWRDPAISTGRNEVAVSVRPPGVLTALAAGG